jgi:hypothetical protein
VSASAPIVATLRRLGASRDRSVDAAEPASRRSLDGSGAPSPRRRAGVPTSPRALLAAAAALLALALPSAALAAEAPSVLHTWATDTGTDSTVLHAQINPNGAATTCHFEYGTTDAFGQDAPCTPAEPLADEVQRISFGNPVGGQIRLIFESQSTPDIPIRSSAQTIEDALNGLAAIGGVGAHVSVTKLYADYFEYLITFEGSLAGTDVPQLAFESGTEPYEGGGINVTTEIDGGLASPVEVTAEVGSLEADTTHSFRLSTTNDVGTTLGDRKTFRTFPTTEPVTQDCANADRRSELHAQFLPDCRAYEMVSPVDKNGGNVIPMYSRTRAADDGNALSFISPTASDLSSGTEFASDFLAERTGQLGTTGWITHGITPLQDPLTAEKVFGAQPLYVGEMSSDLTKGVYLATEQLHGYESANAVGIMNLYLRQDLRASGAGTYVHLTEPFAPRQPSFDPTDDKETLRGASQDFTKVVFDATVALTADAPDNHQVKAYESVSDGTLRLAGRIPTTGDFCDDSNGPVCEPAQQSNPSPPNINKGVRASHIVSPDGSHVLFSVPGPSGGVFVRINGTSTVKLNASEKPVPDGPGVNHNFWAASVDGSRVFFDTDEQLREEDEDSAIDFYMYDFDRPSGDRLTLVSKDSELDGNVADTSYAIGASDTGDYFYFWSNDRLVPSSSSSGAPGIYVWHEGDLSYIGSEFGGAAALQSNSLTAATDESEIIQQVRVTPDGTRLLFSANRLAEFEGHGFSGYENVVPDIAGFGCAHGCTEYLLYDADEEKLKCVTCNPHEAPSIRPEIYPFSELGEISERGVAAGSDHINRPLSDDGQFLFFNTIEALVPRDTNGVIDAYEFDTQSNQFALLSTGTSPLPSYFVEASPSGDDVFIATNQALSSRDLDTARDFYDVRIGGGLPEPAAVPAPCAGDSCLASPRQAPPPPAIGSQAQQPRPGTKACPKKKIRRRGRCVPKRATHRGRHKHHHRSSQVGRQR